MSTDRSRSRYTPEFYRELASAQESAREILPIVLELVKPASIIDIGCGTGHWLATANQLGVSEVLGVDGGWIRDAPLAIRPDQIMVHDLATPLKLNRRFDLALSLEVGEHLPASAARGLLQSICGAADIVLFSAAIPGQGGRHHVNEQWPQYWADIFMDFEYGCYDVVRSQVWSNPRVTWYYAQNCLLFARGTRDAAFGVPGRPLSLVHPALWSAQVARLNSPLKLLERLVRLLRTPRGQKA
jgi:SAM-dependent methyltransferase